MSFSALVKSQYKYKGLINKAYETYKKSPKERLRKESYLLTRLESLEEKWKIFSETHRQLSLESPEGGPSQPTEHLENVYDEGLNNLGISVDSWDAIVIYVIGSKLDSESRKLWEAKISTSDELPTLNQLRDFLQSRFRSLEFLDSQPKVKANRLTPKPKVLHAIAGSNAGLKLSCPFCKAEHKLANCKAHFSQQTAQSQILLATALVQSKARNGHRHLLRALLDQGSQASFVTESAVQLLGLKKIPSQSNITGIGGNKNSLASKYVVTVDIQSRHEPDFKIPVLAHVKDLLPK
ncbi:hypothetical protein OBRU01_19362 [Operophtera brumata]|uniref:Peptidase A2 domain-containing protein n=1 Tax=Operophtera brumata TaxID=104452 RepID=A0A0L7KUL2_OPEBR|nr:hypothetical protein OBRU01_19362 [Operophtera brumata]